MDIQRLSPTEILASVPLEEAREMVWHGLRDAGIPNLLIDTNKNVVVGSTGANLSTYGQNITATLTSTADGTLIAVKSEAQVQGSIDFGKSKRQAQSLSEAIENSLRQGQRYTPPAVDLAPTSPVAPIASPFDVPSNEMGGFAGPVYGTAMPPKRGTAILIYGLLGISCCQIAAPFALIYGRKALKEYGNTDPGDKSMVRIGWILGIIGCVILLLRISLIFVSAINR
jgi:hypothetical protein